MPRYSPIAPIALLENMLGQAIIGNYLLLLAHDVLANQYRYALLLQHIRSVYSENVFIMMDNSLVELGEALEAAAVIEAAKVVRADCIMTPDALGGFEETRRLVEVQTDQLLDSGFDLMRVPQGKDFKELTECVNWLRLQLPAEPLEPEYWGIPRWITNKLGSREPTIAYINGTGDIETSVHLLGMSEDFNDDMACTQVSGVMGIDSANPVVLGQKGYDISAGFTTHMDRGDYWSHSTLSSLAYRNIEWVRDAINC